MTELRKYNPGSHDAFTYGVEIIKATTGSTFNIVTLVDDFSVWESLFAKASQAQFQLADGSGLIDQQAVQPGDKIRVVLHKGEDATPEQKIDKTFEILSINAGAQVANRQGRVYMISCVTLPAVQNKIAPVARALKGKLSDMAKEIATKNLLIAEDKLDIEESDGDKQNVVMPGYRPFKMLSWLANHAVSVAGGVDNSFYLFYEDRDAFRFKTVKQIISDATHHEYTMTSDNARTGDSNKDLYRIIQYRQNKIGSNAGRLDSGMYENELMEFNVLGRKITSQKFDFSEQAAKLQLLGANPVVDFANNFEELRQPISKIKGAIAALRIRSSEEGYGELNTYGRKHAAMLAQKQMFNQISYTLVLAGNCAIKAGDIINIEAADLSAKEVKEMDKFLNGAFLVGNVRHRVSKTSEFATVVDVFKDGFDTEYKPNE